MEREGLGHGGGFTSDGELVNCLAAVGLDINTAGILREAVFHRRTSR